MKNFLVIVFLLTLSFPVFAYDWGLGLPSVPSILSQNPQKQIIDNQETILRRQDCLSRNQRKQQDYSRCIANCQGDKSWCFCSEPYLSYCY